MKKKKAKKPKKVRKLLKKPFNNGTMSNSAFFGWIRSRLRKMSMMGWKPVSVVRNEAKVPYIGDNKRRKFSYICSECKQEKDGSSCSVHHIIPAGKLSAFEDLPDFCRRLFVEKEGLRLLCDECHEAEHIKLKQLEEVKERAKHTMTLKGRKDGNKD